VVENKDVSGSKHGGVKSTYKKSHRLEETPCIPLLERTREYFGDCSEGHALTQTLSQISNWSNRRRLQGLASRADGKSENSDPMVHARVLLAQNSAYFNLDSNQLGIHDSGISGIFRMK